MRKKDYIEKKQLEKTIQEIDKTVDTIIVEGWSDKKMLQKLGFKGKIFLSAEKTVESLVEDVSRRTQKAAVLTDFDSHGKEQAEKISRELQKEIDVVRSARKKFGKQLTSKDRRAVEDIRPLFDDKEEKFVEAAMDQLYFNP
jgi:5S rRNA maturation endonuclease (ribonuclease M5)